MIGNDIVDLQEARLKSNWQRPRFLEKLFTLNEQEMILTAEQSFVMVWRLWSMKEAAYKLYTQLKPSRFYNPKQFECEINDSSGIVRYKNFICEVKTKITSQYLLSEASLNGLVSYSECIEMKSSTWSAQSIEVRAQLLSVIARRFNLFEADLKIVASEFGIPSVYENAQKLPLGISITHHGNFGAFAISHA